MRSCVCGRCEPQFELFTEGNRKTFLEEDYIFKKVIWRTQYSHKS